MRTLVRSPIESMSSNSCFDSFPFEVFFAVVIRTSVVLPMAETTTAIFVPFLVSLTTAITAFKSLSWSDRLEPPNLTTMVWLEVSFAICFYTRVLPRTFLKNFFSPGLKENSNNKSSSRSSGTALHCLWLFFLH